MAALMVMMVLCGCAMRKPVAPDFFAKEEKRLSTLIDNTKEANALSEGHADRARLRIRTDNPHPDYSGALKDFTASLDLNPKRRDGGDIRAWIAVLHKLVDIEQRSILLKSQHKDALSKLADIQQRVTLLKLKYKKAQRYNLSLKNKIEHLEKQEQKLRESIEALQFLELQMEQRRQQLR
jgi:hypothetical protein